ncbi:MAG: DUF4105 domain-containing protein [Pseudomonadota bacterium]
MTFLKYLGDASLLIIAAATAFLAWHALRLHAPDGLTLPLQLLALAALAGAFGLWLWGRPFGWLAMATIIAVHLAWFFAMQPRADRDWAPDLARSTTGTVTDGIATLRDVRAFQWAPDGTATEAWETRTYDLSQITRVDLITSVWGHPDIAHILVTFQFADGNDVAWTIEARRQIGESFNATGGFLRQFELATIAAPESDVVDLRVTARGEQVRRFPTTITPDQGATLFQAYVDYANDLAARPRFYNIVFGNCTTIAWSIAHALKADLPLHPGLLLSGRLPEYLDELGILDGDLDMAARREAALIPPQGR